MVVDLARVSLITSQVGKKIVLYTCEGVGFRNECPFASRGERSSVRPSEGFRAAPSKS